MQPITNYLISSATKASKFLQRDFMELAILQSSSKKTSEFATKSFEKVRTLLNEELSKNYKYILFSDEKPIMSDKADIVLLVNPIDSLENLTRGLPFFAISITYLERNNALLVPKYHIMYFPVLSLIFHAEKGAGCWLKNINNHLDSRLRISCQEEISHSILATNNSELAPKLSKNLRLFGSDCYSAAFFASGKTDFLYLSEINYTLKPGFDMMIREAGGLVLNISKDFIASNALMADQFKHRLKEKLQ